MSHQFVMKVVRQLEYIRNTYDVDIYDISEIRELSMKEGYVELYNILSENPTKYINDILYMTD